LLRCIIKDSNIAKISKSRTALSFICFGSGNLEPYVFWGSNKFLNIFLIYFFKQNANN